MCVPKSGNFDAMDDGRQRTQYPIVTGTSVIAVKYDQGVMMMSDTLGSYGSLARFKNLERIKTAGEFTLLGAGGEYSDFQQLMQYITELEVTDTCYDDGNQLRPAEIYTYLTRVLYNRRNKFNPLWSKVVVAGHADGESFLGTVDDIATAYTGDFIATGFGAHLALPLMRERWRPDFTEGNARQLLEDCMRVLFYRDCRTINRFQLAKATAEGTLVSPPYSLDTKWDFKSFIDPKAGADTGGSW